MKNKWIPIFAGALILLGGASPIFGLTGEGTGQFEKANQSYRQGRYGDAIKLYEKLAAENPEQATVFFNLANSYYRNKQTGAAILAYERAKRFAPRDPDIRYNLNYLQGLLPTRIEDKRNWYLKALEGLLRVVTDRESLFAVSLFYGLLMLSWAVVVLFRRGLPWGWIRKSLLVFFLIFLGFFALKKTQSRLFSDAIVTAKEAEVRYGPSENDQVAFRLGEGLKVYVVDRREDWSRVLLCNGESGWVEGSQISEI